MEPLCSKISSSGSLEKKLAGRCLSVCMYFRQAFSTLEPKRLVGSGRANSHSMRRSGGKTMATVSNRSVAHGTCHVRSRKPLQKNCTPGSGQTNKRTRLKLGGLIATVDGLHPWERRRWRPLHTCGRHVNSDFIISVFAYERRVRLGREGHRSTWRDVLLEDFLWWVAGKKQSGRCLCVCMYVCPSIFASGARTAGWIGTGEYSFDAPERRKDDGNSFGPIGCTWRQYLVQYRRV